MNTEKFPFVSIRVNPWFKKYFSRFAAYFVAGGV